MNLDHLKYPKLGWGYMHPLESIFDAFRYCYENYNPTQVLEIGFHMGHSTTYQLEIYKNAKIKSISPHPEQYRPKTLLEGNYVPPSDRQQMIETMKEIYGNRFGFISGKTQEVANAIVEWNDQISIKFDFALVDGSHFYPYVVQDVQLCLRLGIHCLLADNYNNPEVTQAFEEAGYRKVKEWIYTDNFKNCPEKTSIALVEYTP